MLLTDPSHNEIVYFSTDGDARFRISPALLDILCSRGDSELSKACRLLRDTASFGDTVFDSFSRELERYSREHDVSDLPGVILELR
jgi:hypothetical protein